MCALQLWDWLVLHPNLLDLNFWSVVRVQCVWPARFTLLIERKSVAICICYFIAAIQSAFRDFKHVNYLQNVHINNCFIIIATHIMLKQKIWMKQNYFSRLCWIKICKFSMLRLRRLKGKEANEVLLEDKLGQRK